MDVKIKDIKPNRYNPKITEQHSEKYESIKNGIVEMGMKSPIDVRELEDGTFEIIDGYHRWKACKELSWKEIPISSWGKISEEQAKKITILKEKARVPLDLIKTSEILSELAKDTSLEDLAKQIGYTLPDLSEDLALTDFSWGVYDENSQKETELKDLKSLNIVMLASQYEVIKSALSKAKEENKEFSEGEALQLVCSRFLERQNGS